MKKTVISNSVEDTLNFAEEIIAGKNAGLICLFGDLGAGKTTFVKGLAKALGLDDPVSPTFVYQRIYKGVPEMHHYDFYRLEAPDWSFIEDIHDAYERAIVVIEWPDVIIDHLPEKRIEIKLEHLENSRKITLL